MKRAQALLECAIVAPVLILLAYGAVVLAVGYDQKIRMIPAGRFGADYGAVHGGGQASSQARQLYALDSAAFEDTESTLGWSGDGGLTGVVMTIVHTLVGKDAKMTVGQRSRFAPAYRYDYGRSQHYRAGWSESDRRTSVAVAAPGNLYKTPGDVASALSDIVNDMIDELTNVDWSSFF
mgnify:FL=1